MGSEIAPEHVFRRDRTSAADQVVQDIRERILSRDLPRGTRLPSEKVLAAQYDVSTPTIREAIRALSATSLVESRHGSGTYVTADGSALVASALAAVVALEDVDVLSIFDLAELFYLQAATMALGTATPEDFAELRAAAEAFRPSMRPAQFREALRDFLTRLVELSHNQLLVTISTFLIDSQLASAEDLAKRSPSMWKRIAGHLIDERIAVVTALEARDEDAVRDAIGTYMQRSRQLIEENISRG